MNNILVSQPVPRRGAPIAVSNWTNSMKTLLIGALAVSTACALGSAAAAERTYPIRTVKIIVPASAGTGADIVARNLAQRLAETWGQPVIIEKRDGASGTIGAAVVAKAPPDGYTLVMAFLNHVISPALYDNIPFDILRDFKPIVRTARAPMVIFAHPSFPANSIQELIALAKVRANAKNPIFFGSPGRASVNALSIEMLKQKANIEMTQAPYKGNAQMVTDVLGNQIPLGAAVIGAVLPQVQAGKLKIIAVTAGKRSASLPNSPTVSEAGIANYDVAAWNGLLAPAGTPDAIINEIYTQSARIMQSREVLDVLQKQGLDVAVMNPAEFKEYMAAEVATWAKLVKESGTTAQ